MVNRKTINYFLPVFEFSFFLLISKSVCEVSQSCPTLCNLVDCTVPGFYVHGIFQARVLEWVAISGDLPDPGIEPESAALAGGFFTTEPPGQPK